MDSQIGVRRLVGLLLARRRPGLGAGTSRPVVSLRGQVNGNGEQMALRREENERPHDRGAVIAEFALVFPVLMVFLLGIVTAGMAYNTKIQMTHAVREGARFGTTIPEDQSFVSGTWAENVRDLVVERSVGDLDDASVCVALVTGDAPVPVSNSHTTETSDTDGDGTNDACYDDSGSGEAGLRVQVSASREATIETGLWSRDVTLRAEATGKHETAPA